MIMQNSTFSICFFAKKSKLLKNGKAPLFLRVTVNGRRWETSLNIGLDYNKWDSNKEKCRGFDKNANLVNELIDSTRDKIYRIKLRIDQEDKHLTIENIKYFYFDRQREKKSILQLFDNHNNFCEKKVGINMSKATYERYLTCRNHFSDFIKKEFDMSDLPIGKIDKDLFEKFHLYLRANKKCANNTTVKYIRNFNKIVRIAVDKGWLSCSPYKEAGFRLEEIEKPYLTKEELHSIQIKEIRIHRLEIVRDIFIFCCYSGLAFSDVKELSKDNIQLGIDGKKWISKHRKKTDVLSKIPLFGIPEVMIEKYQNDPLCIVKEVLLPVPSNQKMNAYLKEIADICGINKVLTTHTARRTFATTVLLQDGVPMESVSKMLGHRSLYMTRKYAKIDELFIAKTTETVREKLQKTP
jgi:integrase